MKRAREKTDCGDNESASPDGTGTSNGISTSADDLLLLHKGKNTKKHVDEGHRYGNFHNYYTFHPVSNRTKHIEEILKFIAEQWNVQTPLHQKDAFRYTDIGCNEGDLTLEIAKQLSNRISYPSLSSQLKVVENDTVFVPQRRKTKIICTGLDLDADLIQRAQRKVSEDAGLQPNIVANFEKIDVLHEDIVLHQNVESSTDCVTPSIEYSSDFTTLFSTTMWIHIHGGDDGLRRVLQKICAVTRHWILLEPQPSKCYGRAAIRLRRLGLPPIDVSNERLRLRPNIEEAIENILKELHFERLKVINQSSSIESDDVSLQHPQRCEEIVETKTQWNRQLQLYQRVNISNTGTL